MYLNFFNFHAVFLRYQGLNRSLRAVHEQRYHLRPAGRQFDMPELYSNKFETKLDELWLFDVIRLYVASLLLPFNFNLNVFGFFRVPQEATALSPSPLRSGETSTAFQEPTLASTGNVLTFQFLLWYRALRVTRILTEWMELIIFKSNLITFKVSFLSQLGEYLKLAWVLNQTTKPC